MVDSMNSENVKNTNFTLKLALTKNNDKKFPDSFPNFPFFIKN